MQNWKKYLLELVVIVLSILLAFWLENLRQDLQTAQLKRQTIQQIVAEIEHNKLVLESNYEILKTFNESARLLDYLNGSSEIGDQISLMVDVKVLDSLKDLYPTNRYIQALNGPMISNNIVLENDLVVDFFLERMVFGTWDSSKSSGTLIGINQEILAIVSDFYSRLDTQFGYTEQDYHRSLLNDYNSFAPLEDILNATTRLEQVYALKLSVLNENYSRKLGQLKGYEN